jgi:hypothetical protein
MKKLVFSSLLFLAALPGCGHVRYPGWEYVRIEHSVPSENCEYKIQEACGSGGAHCYNWFKQKATRYGANTVVITESSQGFSSKGSAIVYQGSGGGNSRATSTLIALADYYYCPKQKDQPQETQEPQASVNPEN